MKALVAATLFFIAMVVLGAPVFAAEPMRTATGKVTAVDPSGKAIVLDSGMGKSSLTVGAVVGAKTVLKVKGKEVPLSDLQKEIKDGDRVTLRYRVGDDLYAVEIDKK
jgi:hypothetical protein